MSFNVKNNRIEILGNEKILNSENSIFNEKVF